MFLHISIIEASSARTGEDLKQQKKGHFSKEARADRTLWINIALAKVSSVKLDSMSRRKEEFKSEEQIQSLL
ncbi:hypothetical protein PFLUV_G00043700 [Perca fluviatilis]|uniref:Uncharacterized protein n=1 Tax=Perca fluviatilis TaxID=8168 RepID=A0A6A5FP50_PERFL|nr:hypothetical protein PFLUV_G00043700 [Perca fluviatilis]